MTAVVTWGAVAVPGSVPEIAPVSPEAGPAGTEVVVLGENFGPSIGSWLGTSSVSFSGKTGSPYCWSETQIRVPVRAEVESGLVVVTAGGSVSFGGHSISSFSSQGYSWSNTSISLLIPGSLGAGQVSVSVTTSGETRSNSYSCTVTGSPVSRGDCPEEDCPKKKEDEESEDSEEGESEEDSSDDGG